MKTRETTVKRIFTAPDTGGGKGMELNDGTTVYCSTKLPTPNVGDTVKIETVSGGRFRNIDHHCE